MKIVNILGGLGNQMFVYAMYLALKTFHTNEEVFLCRRSYNGYPLHNGYELDRIFGIEAPEASLLQLSQVAFPFFNYKTWQVMRHWLPVRYRTMTRGAINIPFDYSQVTRKDNCYYDGYWQNEKNFKNIRNDVLKAYSFPAFTDEQNIELVSLLKYENSVSCHVRRGDYLKQPEMCVCTPEYYSRAISKMNDIANPSVYVIFSDDIKWCKEKLNSIIGKGRKIVFVDWNNGEDSYKDMQLMTLCNHNIIANSSFSWWGAWLNQHENKIVISPDKWMKSNNIQNDPISDDWIRIK